MHEIQPTRYGLVVDPKITVHEAAMFLGVSLSTTWRLIRKGELGYYQIGGRTVVGMSQIETLLLRAEKGMEAQSAVSIAKHAINPTATELSSIDF